MAGWGDEGEVTILERGEWERENDAPGGEREAGALTGRGEEGE